MLSTETLLGSVQSWYLHPEFLALLPALVPGACQGSLQGQQSLLPPSSAAPSPVASPSFPEATCNHYAVVALSSHNLRPSRLVFGDNADERGSSIKQEKGNDSSDDGENDSSSIEHCSTSSSSPRLGSSPSSASSPSCDHQHHSHGHCYSSGEEGDASSVVSSPSQEAAATTEASVSNTPAPAAAVSGAATPTESNASGDDMIKSSGAATDSLLKRIVAIAVRCEHCGVETTLSLAEMHSLCHLSAASGLAVAAASSPAGLHYDPRSSSEDTFFAVTLRALWGRSHAPSCAWAVAAARHSPSSSFAPRLHHSDWAPRLLLAPDSLDLCASQCVRWMCAAAPLAAESAASTSRRPHALPAGQCVRQWVEAASATMSRLALGCPPEAWPESSESLHDLRPRVLFTGSNADPRVLAVLFSAATAPPPPTVAEDPTAMSAADATVLWHLCSLMRLYGFELLDSARPQHYYTQAPTLTAEDVIPASDVPNSAPSASEEATLQQQEKRSCTDGPAASELLLERLGRQFHCRYCACVPPVRVHTRVTFRRRPRVVREGSLNTTEALPAVEESQQEPSRPGTPPPLPPPPAARLTDSTGSAADAAMGQPNVTEDVPGDAHGHCHSVQFVKAEETTDAGEPEIPHGGQEEPPLQESIWEPSEKHVTYIVTCGAREAADAHLPFCPWRKLFLAAVMDEQALRAEKAIELYCSVTDPPLPSARSPHFGRSEQRSPNRYLNEEQEEKEEEAEPDEEREKEGGVFADPEQIDYTSSRSSHNVEHNEDETEVDDIQAEMRQLEESPYSDTKCNTKGAENEEEPEGTGESEQLHPRAESHDQLDSQSENDSEEKEAENLPMTPATATREQSPSLPIIITETLQFRFFQSEVLCLEAIWKNTLQLARQEGTDNVTLSNTSNTINAGALTRINTLTFMDPDTPVTVGTLFGRQAPFHHLPLAAANTGARGGQEALQRRIDAVDSFLGSLVSHDDAEGTNVPATSSIFFSTTGADNLCGAKGGRVASMTGDSATVSAQRLTQIATAALKDVARFSRSPTGEESSTRTAVDSSASNALLQQALNAIRAGPSSFDLNAFRQSWSSALSDDASATSAAAHFPSSLNVCHRAHMAVAPECYPAEFVTALSRKRPREDPDTSLSSSTAADAVRQLTGSVKLEADAPQNPVTGTSAPTETSPEETETEPTTADTEKVHPFALLPDVVATAAATAALATTSGDNNNAMTTVLKRLEAVPVPEQLRNAVAVASALEPPTPSPSRATSSAVPTAFAKTVADLLSRMSNVVRLEERKAELREKAAAQAKAATAAAAAAAAASSAAAAAAVSTSTAAPSATTSAPVHVKVEGGLGGAGRAGNTAPGRQASYHPPPPPTARPMPSAHGGPAPSSVTTPFHSSSVGGKAVLPTPSGNTAAHGNVTQGQHHQQQQQRTSYGATSNNPLPPPSYGFYQRQQQQQHPPQQQQQQWSQQQRQSTWPPPEEYDADPTAAPLLPAAPIKRERSASVLGSSPFQTSPPTAGASVASAAVTAPSFNANRGSILSSQQPPPPPPQANNAYQHPGQGLLSRAHPQQQQQQQQQQSNNAYQQSGPAVSHHHSAQPQQQWNAAPSVTVKEEPGSSDSSINTGNLSAGHSSTKTSAALQTSRLQQRAARFSADKSVSNPSVAPSGVPPNNTGNFHSGAGIISAGGGGGGGGGTVFRSGTPTGAVAAATTPAAAPPSLAGRPREPMFNPRSAAVLPLPAVSNTGVVVGGGGSILGGAGPSGGRHSGSTGNAGHGNNNVMANMTASIAMLQQPLPPPPQQSQQQQQQQQHSRGGRNRGPRRGR